MSITKKEAIEILQLLAEAMPPGSFQEIFNMAASAHRPITREQVEKMRGEWIKEDPPVEFYICSKCGESAVATSDHGYHYRSAFCPHCGAPMTDDAVDILAKRLEEAVDGETCGR